jgi:hypothetical protein
VAGVAVAVAARVWVAMNITGIGMAAVAVAAEVAGCMSGVHWSIFAIDERVGDPRPRTVPLRTGVSRVATPLLPK